MTHYSRWKRTGQVGTAALQNAWGAAKQICADCGERPVGPHGGKGICSRCHGRRRVAELAAQQIPCSVPGCTKVVSTAGARMCIMHKIRLWKRGDVGGAEPEIAPRGTGTTDANGYRRIGRRAEHHLVMEQILGRPLWPDESVHHKNGIRDDNRPENLELWSVERHGQRQRNGQRVADIVEFWVSRYPDEARRVLRSLTKRTA